MSYNILKPWETLDEWQKKYIETEGNCALLTGRQVGKSTAMSIKAGKLAVTNSNFPILIIAFTEKQAFDIFWKTLNYLEAQYPHMIKKGKDKPTMHEINLKNGSTIECYATGKYGEGIRGKTCKKIFVDEARNIAREVFVAISPMVAVTGGSMDISSTPAGKEGFFWDIFDPKKNLGFTKFYVSGEDCPRYTKDFLDGQKKVMSTLEYAQEYLAIFLDDLKRLFSDDLINRVCTLKREGADRGRYYLGVDVAGLGRDETTYEVIKKIDGKLRHVENIIETKNLTTDTANRIKLLNSLYLEIKYIGVDDGGAGFGVFCELLENYKTKRKTKALNNASRPTDSEGKKTRKLLKEEMYFSLLSLMEKGDIKLLDDESIVESLKSVQYEPVIREGRGAEFRIFGNYTHVVEGIIRAVWLATQDKSLNIWCAFN